MPDLDPSHCPHCKQPLQISHAQARVAQPSPRTHLFRILGVILTLALLVGLVFVFPYLDSLAQIDSNRRARRLNLGLLTLLSLALCLLPALLSWYVASFFPRIGQATCPHCFWSGRVSIARDTQPASQPAELYESSIEGIPDLDDPIEGRRERLRRREVRRDREQTEEQGPNPDFDFRS